MRNGSQLARVPHFHPHQIDALVGQIPGHGEVQGQGSHAHQGHHGAVAQHDHQVKKHHHRVQRQRGHGVHQRARNGGVGALPLQNIASHALGEKLHGQFQYLPHKGGVALDGHFAVDLQAVNGLCPLHDDLEARQQDHGEDEGTQPFRGLPRQQPVKEDAGHDGIDDAEQIRNDGGQHDKGHGGGRALQALPGKRQGALALAGGREAFPGLEGQHQAGEGLVKLLHGHLHHAPGGIVEHSLVALEAVQHHEMIEIPMDDAGKGSLLFQGFHFHAVAVHLQPIALGGQVHIFHIGAVPAYAAICAHNLQGNPFLIVRQHHGKAGRAALQRFHLHDHRHLRDPVFDGLLHSLFSHRQPPSIPQEADGRGGFQHQLCLVVPLRKRNIKIVC